MSEPVSSACKIYEKKNREEYRRLRFTYRIVRTMTPIATDILLYRYMYIYNVSKTHTPIRVPSHGRMRVIKNDRPRVSLKLRLP